MGDLVSSPCRTRPVPSLSPSQFGPAALVGQLSLPLAKSTLPSSRPTPPTLQGQYAILNCLCSPGHAVFYAGCPRNGGIWRGLRWILWVLLGCDPTGRSRLCIPLQMRDVLKTEELDVPEGVTVEIKSRLITVSGPRGKISKNVRHIDMDIRLVQQGKTNKVTLAVWQGGRKHVACLRTIKSLISNMITGVTKVCTYVLCIQRPYERHSFS